MFSESAQDESMSNEKCTPGYMSNGWDGWDGIGYHRSSKSTFVANNLNFKGFVHID